MVRSLLFTLHFNIFLARMKRAPLIVLFVLLLLAAGGYWFWSLGTPVVEAKTAIRLHDLKGQVEHSGTDHVWKTATENETVASGDTIRTGSDGQVSIDFFHQGETRLAPSSTLVIADDTKNNEEAGTLTVHLRLEQGRVWSRVRQLLNLKSEYAVTTDQVVATVRGTAFSLAKNQDGTSSLLVSHSVVQGNNGLIPEGYKQTFGKSRRRASSPVRISPEEWQDTWMKKNQAEDTRMLQEWKQEDRRAFGTSQSKMMTKLTMLSSGLHGLMNGDEPLRIGEQAAQREIGLIHDLARQGKTEEALAEIKSAKERLATIDLQSVEAHNIFARLFPPTQRLFSDINEGDTGYLVKQELEKTIFAQTSTDTASKVFQKTIEMNQLLDAALQAQGDGQVDEAKAKIAKARSLIETALDNPPTDLSRETSKELQERWQAAELRLNNFPDFTPDFNTTSSLKSPESGALDQKLQLQNTQPIKTDPISSMPTTQKDDTTPPSSTIQPPSDPLPTKEGIAPPPPIK